VQYVPKSYIMTSMGYEDIEFEPALTPLEAIDETARQLLADATPTNRYAVRDVQFDATGQLVIIDREAPTAITPDTQYREIVDRRPVRSIAVLDSLPAFGTNTTYLKVARWYNSELFEEYRDQIFEPVPRFQGLLNACVATTELHFVVPRPIPAEERDEFHPDNHQYLAAFALRGFYFADGPSYRSTNTAAPDFSVLFASRRKELCEAVIDCENDPKKFARDRNMDLDNLSKDERILLYEIEKIMWLSVIREQSLVEATHEYLAEESVQCSREMERRFTARLRSKEGWQDTHDLLVRYAAHITSQQSGVKD
jgi:hypothetical protein